MTSAIKVVEKLNTFLVEKIKEFCLELNVDYELHFHSNLQPETNNQKLRILISRQIIREEQDTLAVNVEDFGRVRYTSEGVYVISFFAPRNISGSYFKMEQLAQKLKNSLRLQRFECVWLRDIIATPFNIEQNSYRYELAFNYQFDEII